MFTQNNEHEIIVPFFKDFDPEELNFLDVGANDGKTFSNTWDLALLGWGGCCLEPSPSAFRILQENYIRNERVYLFNYGISYREGLFTFHESKNWVDKNDTPPGILSSLNEDHKNRFFGMEWEVIECNFVTFATFFAQSPVKKFDFISIDVEGHDIVVLKQIDLREIGCKMICLEFNQDQSLLKDFTNYCSQFDFFEIHQNRDNVIFQKRM